MKISVPQQEREKLEARMKDYEVLYDTLETELERIEQNAQYDTLNHRNREILLLLEKTISAVQSPRQASNLALLHAQDARQRFRALHSKKGPKWQPKPLDSELS